MPVRPDSSPMVAPATSAGMTGGSRVGIEVEARRTKNGALATSKSAPRTGLKTAGGSVRYPPSPAAGTDAIRNGRSTGQEKFSFRANRSATTLDTSTLSTSAVGLIAAGAKPDSAMTATNPEAPAWPTLA